MTPIRTSNHQMFCRRTIRLCLYEDSAFIRQSASAPDHLPRHLRATPVDFQDLLNRARLPVRNPLQSLFHHCGNGGKRDLFIQKRLHRDFVGRVQRTGSRSAGSLRFIGQPRARGISRNRAGKMSRTAPRVQSSRGTGRIFAVGISQRVLDRHAHVGRRDLSDHAAVRVLHHSMHRRLRMDHHIHFIRAQNRTASRPRSLRSLCSSRWRNRS